MSGVVERAKAALEGVTDGPWRTEPSKYVAGRYLLGRRDHMEWEVMHATGTVGRSPDAEFIAAARSLVPELVAEVERLEEELEVLHPAVLYRTVIEQLSLHRWARTAVLQGQYCQCGYNGDHENHLVLCIVRAIESLAVSDV